MNCPVCKTVDLMITERQGVEIDYCPQCRGIWLDRGELDKIVERSYQQPPRYREENRDDREYRTSHESRHGEHHHSEHGYHRKKSWLSELFD